ncbi:hypothetical protein O4M77_04090 [Acinetobacter sp. YWS30-1]|uniref:tetratricopeptide repeat protein n=1 Tax=Acinetobacter sp. YWS30-1 TaxID=2996862 RepID=UPI002B2618FE|nr:hypothetical protein [Acinetobacter sp. YWS30-1]WPC35616.1 hypothetical protein O4M77_04090 [Acinetobacter sp. YWS30-1]
MQQSRSLNSDWVQKEINLAKNLYDQGALSRIFPIIIDKNISYEDVRIPQWMKETKNIQHIVAPKTAARKINQRLTVLAWETHPSLKSKHNFFVGRNDKIANIEMRLDDFAKKTVSTLFVTGLPSIGRKTFIKHSLTKANLIRDYYNFLTISLESNSGIEDFILKLIDLGFTDHTLEENLITKSIDNKIEIAVKILKNLKPQKERLLIEDNGVLVQGNGNLADWFSKILDQLKSDNYLSLVIACIHKPTRIYNEEHYFQQELFELTKPERNGFLKRYSNFLGLELEQEDLILFSSILTGYPDQVKFAVDLINIEGLFEAKRQTHLIQQYASEKAKIILESFKDEKDLLDLLYLLSKFDFISYKLLFELVDIELYYPKLTILLSKSICEKIGNNSDYIRVNNVIKEYILRNNFGTNTKFDKILNIHVDKFLLDIDLNDKDLSDINFSIRTALKEGKTVPHRLLIPSYFLKTIIELYNKKGINNFKECIKLADRVLENTEFIEDSIINKIYFYKCQSLARLKDSKFFETVRLVPQPDNSFLCGFYHRLMGNPDQAIKDYEYVLTKRPKDFRVISELVLLYIQKDQHDKAIDLAKNLYETYPNNPINAINYLKCLLHGNKSEINIPLIQEVIDNLESINTDKAIEMSFSAKAQLLAKKGQFQEAYRILGNAIHKFPNVSYPKLSLADIAVQDRNVHQLQIAVNMLEKHYEKHELNQSNRSYVKYKAILLALQNKVDSAKLLIENELRSNTSRSYIDEIKNKIEQYA